VSGQAATTIIELAKIWGELANVWGELANVWGESANGS
jgi:hypothetical protein